MELDVKNILNVLHEAEFADGDWFQLGQQLIKHSALKTIEANHSGGNHCMIDTISQWLRTDLEASWVKLAEAVTKVGGYGEVTAKIVRQNACKELDVRTVLNALHKAEFSDGDWFQLGQQLITNAALRTIRAHHFDAGNCMIDTISQWLRTDLEASWEKLAEAITKVGGYGEATAKVVRQKTGIAAFMPCPLCGRADFRTQRDLELHCAECTI